MKILAIGDPHFQTSNVVETQMLMERVLQEVAAHQPDHIVILGDLLHEHERINVLPLNKAYEFVTLLSEKTNVFVIVGNHDMCNNSQFLTTNHWMNAMKCWDRVTIVDEIQYLHHNDKFITLAPYVAPGRFREALATGSLDWRQSVMIFAHQEFKGCKMGAIESNVGDEWDATHPPVVSGHIHARQTLPGVYYTGSAMQHAFGESKHNSIALIQWDTFETNAHRVTEIDLGMPRKKIIYANICDVIDKPVEINRTGKTKLSVEGSYDQFKSWKKTTHYKQLVDQGVKIVFKPTSEKKQWQDKWEAEKNSTFVHVLASLIEKSENEYIAEIYKQII